MPYLIAFDLSSSENEVLVPTLVLANANQSHLGNLSLITHNREMKLDSKFLEETNKNNIQLFSYSTKEEFDQYLITKHALFLFRICQTIPAITPLSTPLAVYGPKQAKHGDIFCENSEWVMDTANIQSLTEQFHTQIIQPISTIVPTFGICNKETAVIFIGSRPQKDITVVPIDAMRSAISLPESQRHFVPSTTMEKKEESKEQTPLPSLSILKQTLDSITSRKNDKIRIKMVCNWTSSFELLRDWSHMIEDSSAIRNIEWITDGIPDYWVVINKPPAGELIIPKQTIVFRMEPYIDKNYFYNDWLAGKKKSDFLYFLDHEHHRNNTEWWLKMPISELKKPIQKSALFSTVTSSQYQMEGHRLRVNFLKFFQANSKIPLHVFGHDNTHQLLNYQGSLPLREKNLGVLPYKYHFASENSDIPNYMTEKFFDALIGECLLFYWGCPNITEHFDERAFIRLDLRNPPEALRIIENAIFSNEWEKRLPIIRKEKERIIRLFNPFIRISSLLHIQSLKYVQICNFNSRGHFVSPGPLENNEGINGQIIPGLNVENFFPSPQMHILFKHFRNYTRAKISLGQVARLMQHAGIWVNCANENRPFLIFEGTPVPNFLDHLSEMWAAIKYSEIKWDLIALQWTFDSNSTALITTPSEHTILCSLEPCFMDPEKIANFPNLYHGNIGSGYILHPEAAKNLVNFVNDYGFLNCLDEFLFSIPALIQNWKTWIISRNLIIPKQNEDSEESCHVFRKISEDQWNTAVPQFIWPPVSGSEVRLVPESNVPKIPIK
jgi:hypothetical protein